MKDNIIRKLLSNELLYLFNTGKCYHAFRTFGAHPLEDGTQFTVWVPGVRGVRIAGDFNGWHPDDQYALEQIGDTGVYTGFIPGIQIGYTYKFELELNSGERILKSDPFAYSSENRPGTASVVWDSTYDWTDAEWLDKRNKTNTFKSPMNIYEMHMGSWEREPGSETFYSYSEIADRVIPYVKDMGYTHIELLPVMEHPLDASWGYQVTGFYSPTRRYGSPDDLKYFMNKCHEEGIGVIIDWVPGHFCPDAHGLSNFNGDKLYETEIHPDWGTYKFDFARNQVRSFLLSNAMYWVEVFHVDGIRVDGVSSMLYLNFGVTDRSKFKTNKDGGDGDLDAISFIKDFNYMIGTLCPGVFTVAEESSAWPMVTWPPEKGGLGFHYKWNMGWMNDTLEYMKTDFPFRSYHHNKLTFSLTYAYSENFILPLSHDEVVHGKASLIGRMPGDTWRQFAGSRMLMLYQMTHPGKKLRFMGHEIAQFIEWREYEQLEWFLLEYDNHKKHQRFVKDLNKVYLENPALWAEDTSWDGFRWIDADNRDQGVYSYTGMSKDELLVVVMNTDVQAFNEFTIGVPERAFYKEIINSDDTKYAGSGVTNTRQVRAKKQPMHGMPYSITIKVPAVGGCILKMKRKIK
jgi:1,4-alpha-glucan branching enzyme